jgi:hypothetical protein
VAARLPPSLPGAFCLCAYLLNVEDRLEDGWLRQASEAIREAIARRDDLIFDASEAGMSRREVAAAVGLTPGRIQQIIDERGRGQRP